MCAHCAAGGATSPGPSCSSCWPATARSGSSRAPACRSPARSGFAQKGLAELASELVPTADLARRVGQRGIGIVLVGDPLVEVARGHLGVELDAVGRLAGQTKGLQTDAIAGQLDPIGR